MTSWEKTVNDMRKLLSGALPAPGDEPPQRDVIGAAMEWGERRRRRDWTLAGAAALAVLAVGAGAAALGGGSGAAASPGTGQRSLPLGVSASGSSGSERPGQPNWPEGTWWTPTCDEPTSVQGNLADYCRLFNEEQTFSTDFAKGSVKYLQAALPPGYSVQATNAHVVILTGPTGTNYLFPSVTGASTFSGRAPGCGADPSCYQTSVAGGNVVVGPAPPSGAQSGGWVEDDLKDPRITITVGTIEFGGMNGIPAPTAHALLTNEQLAKLLSDPHLRDYAKAQYQHLVDITRQLQGMAPPSGTPSYRPPPSHSLLPGGSSTESFSASQSWTPPTGSTSSSESGSPPGTPTGAAHS